MWPPLLKPREPLSPLPRPSLCDLCLLPPVFVPECNKLKKDASTVSHSDPGPLPIWSLKCSHGLPRSGGSSGGRKCPPPCPVASRPAAGTASEWQGGHTGGAATRGCLVESAVHLIHHCHAGSGQCPSAGRRTAAAISDDDAVPAADDTVPHRPPATATSCRTRARGR